MPWSKEKAIARIREIGLIPIVRAPSAEDAFRAANYSPNEIRMLREGVRKRIKELVELPNVLTARRPNP